MVSGDSGDPLMMSMAAVRWLHPSDDWGVWVDVNEVRRFETSVYNFPDTVRELSGSSYVLTWATTKQLKLRRDMPSLVEYEQLNVWSQSNSSPNALSLGFECDPLE